MQLHATAAWATAYPGAVAGAILLAGLENPTQHPHLRAHARTVEAAIRARYQDIMPDQLDQDPVLQAYRNFYRRFGQNYHVQRQLESVLFKGKSLNSGSALVEAMFVAEVQSLLLTAGHDVAALDGEVTVDIARAGDRFTGMGEREHANRPGDMLMRDASGIISAVTQGPDHRTRLTAATRSALFTCYAPAGIGAAAVRQHLAEIAANTRRVATGAEVVMLTVHVALGLPG